MIMEKCIQLNKMWGSRKYKIRNPYYLHRPGNRRNVIYVLCIGGSLIPGKELDNLLTAFCAYHPFMDQFTVMAIFPNG